MNTKTSIHRYADLVAFLRRLCVEQGTNMHCFIGARPGFLPLFLQLDVVGYGPRAVYGTYYV